MKNQIVKIGLVELTTEEAKELYESGRNHIITYTKIYAINYDETKNKFYGIQLFQAGNGEKFTRRGRFYAMNKDDAAKLLS